MLKKLKARFARWALPMLLDGEDIPVPGVRDWKDLFHHAMPASDWALLIPAWAWLYFVASVKFIVITVFMALGPIVSVFRIAQAGFKALKAKVQAAWK